MSRARSLRLTPLVWLLGLGACTSVLGIEDLHQGPRDADGSGADAGSGATQSTAGDGNSGGGTGNTSGSSNATAGSSSNQAGVPGSDAGSGNEPVGGSNGTAGTGGTDNVAGAAGDAGAGGAGGAGTPTTGTVHGKVVDRWGKVVANATIQIGTEQASSDATGAFSLENVAATYDIAILIGDIAWVYQGLTRRDPTLEFWEGAIDRGNTVEATFSAPRPTLPTDNDTLTIAFGTPTGSTEYRDVWQSEIDSSATISTDWEGPTTTQMTGHALLWTNNNTTKLPQSYKAFDDKTFGVVNGVNAAVAFKASTTAVTPAAITGTATSAGPGSRVNSMFVRYPSGASIQVVDHDSPASDAFTYQAPTLSNTTITFAAWDGYFDGPLGLVHKDGLSPGGSTGTLKIPLPPSQLTPAGGAMVDAATSFSFKASPDNAGAFVLVVSNLVAGPQRLYVVTTQKKFTLPNVLDGAWVLTPGDDYQWWVETHGSAKTVDDMTGPTGFSDEFGQKYITPVATHVADGTYTYTALREFTAK